MASIGSLAVSISANSAAFEAGLDRAARKAEQFGQQISRTLTSPIRDVAKLASLPGDVISGALKPIQQIASSIPFIGGAFAAIPTTGAGFTAWLKSSLDEVVNIGKEAQRLGVSVEFFSSLGSLGEGAAVGIQHMQRTLAAAAGGSVEAQRAFKNLGLSWKDLVAAGNEEAFKRVVDEIARLPDAIQRAKAASDIFGERAVHDAGLQNLIAKGPGGIDQLMERGQRTGLQISGGQFGEALKAKAALSEIEDTVKGIGRQFAVDLAPYVKLAADAFRDLVQMGGGPSKWVADFIDALMKGVAMFLDEIEALVDVFKEWTGDLESVGEFFKQFKVQRGIQDNGQIDRRDLEAARDNGIFLVDENGNRIKQFEKDREAAKRWGDSVRDAAKQARDALNKVTQVVGPVDIWAEARKSVGALTDSIKDQMNTLGMSAAQADIHKKALAGVPEEILKPAREAAEALEKMQRALSLPTQSLNAYDDYAIKLERLAKLFQEGKINADQFWEQGKQLQQKLKDNAVSDASQIFKDMASPLDKFQAEMERINQAVEKGGLDPTAAIKAKAAAFKNLEGSVGALPGQLAAPSLSERGSAADFADIVNFNRKALTPDDPQERIRQAIEAAKAIEEKQLLVQQRMAQALDKIADNTDEPVDNDDTDAEDFF